MSFPVQSNRMASLRPAYFHLSRLCLPLRSYSERVKVRNLVEKKKEVFSRKPENFRPDQKMTYFSNIIAKKVNTCPSAPKFDLLKFLGIHSFDRRVEVVDRGVHPEFYQSHEAVIQYCYANLYSGYRSTEKVEALLKDLQANDYSEDQIYYIQGVLHAIRAEIACDFFTMWDAKKIDEGKLEAYKRSFPNSKTKVDEESRKLYLQEIQRALSCFRNVENIDKMLKKFPVHPFVENIIKSLND